MYLTCHDLSLAIPIVPRHLLFPSSWYGV